MAEGPRDTGETDPALGPTLRGAAVPAGDVWLGTRYRVKRLLGRGGMGAVYLASDEVLMCDVALKRLAHADDQSLAQLRDEVRLAQKVTHENVCRTFDLEEVEVDGWLVKMEYVDGETLAARIARGPLAVADAVAIARAVCAGLAAAHRQGVVHRDLKPQNILLEAKTGRVVLTDFGLARAAVLAGKTAENISGTPEYMAPEQARGREVDGRADLYALGCVIYEMLTGDKVFRRSTAMATALAHAEEPPPVLPARFPEPLRRLVARLLEKDPARRPDDADEVATALAPSRRRRTWLAVVSAIAVAVAGAAAAFLLDRPRHQWQPETKELADYDEDSDVAAISPDGKLIAYHSDRERRGFDRIYVQPLDGSSVRALTPPGMDAIEPRWTRDGKAVLFTDLDRAYRVPLEGGTPEILAEDAYAVEDCGGALIFLYWDSPGCPYCNRLALRDSTGQERDLARFSAEATVQYPRCDRDGRRVLYSKGESRAHWWSYPDYDLWLLSIDGGQPQRLTTDRGSAIGTFAPDGRSVIYSTRREEKSNLWELALEGKAAPVQLTSSLGTEFAPDVSPDGRFLVYNIDTSSSQLFAQQVGGGAPRRLTALRDIFQYLSVTPDGEALVAQSDFFASRPRIISLPVGGGDPRSLVDGQAPALSPDGSEVLYSDGERVLALGRSDGKKREVTRVPGRVLFSRTGSDERIHMVVARPQGWEAWSAPAAGGEAAQDLPKPWYFLWPAPRGGWAMARRRTDTGRNQVAFRPPGGTFDETHTLSLSGLETGAWSPDGLVFYYVRGGEVRELTLATGSDRRVAEVPQAAGVAVSPDGQTLYLTRSIGRTRRALITNLADRPRR